MQLLILYIGFLHTSPLCWW